MSHTNTHPEKSTPIKGGEFAIYRQLAQTIAKRRIGIFLNDTAKFDRRTVNEKPRIWFDLGLEIDVGPEIVHTENSRAYAKYISEQTQGGLARIKHSEEERALKDYFQEVRDSFVLGFVDPNTGWKIDFADRLILWQWLLSSNLSNDLAIKKPLELYHLRWFNDFSEHIASMMVITTEGHPMNNHEIKAAIQRARLDTTGLAPELATPYNSLPQRGLTPRQPDKVKRS